MIYDHLPPPGGTWVCGCKTETHAMVGEADACRRGKVLEGLSRRNVTVESYDAMLANLTSVQARCTELTLENRKLREGILLPGWTCASCGGFTGTEKEAHAACRACGAAKPT